MALQTHPKHSRLLPDSTAFLPLSREARSALRELVDMLTGAGALRPAPAAPAGFMQRI